MNDNDSDSSDDDLIVRLRNNSKQFKDFKLIRYPFMKPSFSPHPYGWAMDHVIGLWGLDWLFCININTRYLVVYPVPENSKEVIKALTDLCRRFTVKTIKSDYSSTYRSDDLKKFYDKHNITHYNYCSDFGHQNAIIDRAIKTIRMYAKKLKTNDMQEVVDYYNNTKHRMIKCPPAVMMQDPTGEWNYINRCQRELKEVNERLKELGVLDYQPGDWLFVHLNLAKTDNKFDKQENDFNYIGQFVEYFRGNVRVSFDKGNELVPMYCTRPVPKGYDINDGRTSFIRKEKPKRTKK